MRLWHWKLISVLPQQQLSGQWRECCAIAKSISEKGTPNHILVNPIMNYPLSHFCWYSYMVYFEMKSRGYSVDWSKFSKWFDAKGEYVNAPFPIKSALLFHGWHTGIYLKQCYYNLEEKHDRGGISDLEWIKIQEKVGFL